MFIRREDRVEQLSGYVHRLTSTSELATT